MNKKLMRMLGFSNEVEAVESGMCPLCKHEIDMNEFDGPLSIKEYHISGMCQSCQDDLFG